MLPVPSPSLADLPEGELLIACAQHALGTPDSSPANPLSDRLLAPMERPLRWDLVLRSAQQQGLIPALHRSLDRQPAVPQAVRDRLRLLFRVNAARNKQLLNALGEVLALFAAHEIPALPYKGPVLAVTLYGDLSRRACGDLDVLVRPGDLLRGRDLLLAQGYAPQHRFRDRNEEQQHLRAECEYNLERSSDGVLVELHWAFHPRSFPLPLDMDDLWDRTRTVRVGGLTTLTMASEDLLLVLCVHGAKHCWERLGWICDVAALLRAHPDLDGRTLASEAKALGCERVLWLGLTLARDLLGADPPAPFGTRPPAVMAALAAQVRRQIVGPKDRPLLRGLFHLRVRDRLSDRLPYMRRQAHWWFRGWFREPQEKWKS